MSGIDPWALLALGYTGCLTWCMLTSYLHGRELSNLRGEVNDLKDAACKCGEEHKPTGE